MKNVKVAIIDSGIQLDAMRESSRKNIEIGYLIQRDMPISIIDFKKDMLCDENGHGTACATEINRIAPNAKIIPICILGQNGRCSSMQLIAALDIVKYLDIQIVNMSISSNDIKIRHRLNKLITELQEQGKICVASKSNDRWMSYPADLKYVLGVIGSPAIFNDRYEYNHNRRIQIVASGAAELMGYRFPQLKFFKGNSRASAIVSGILAEAFASEDLEDRNCLEKYLLNNTYAQEMLYRRPDTESKNLLVYNEVYSCIMGMISHGVIQAHMTQSGELIYENSTIDDFYMIINTLEDYFACKIFREIPVYKRYFESVSYLSRLIEDTINE